MSKLKGSLIITFLTLLFFAIPYLGIIISRTWQFTDGENGAQISLGVIAECCILIAIAGIAIKTFEKKP